MKPYKRIWTAFVTAALFAISMPDKFLELYKEFMHSGLTPAFGVALALWVSKEYRNKRLDRRDMRWEKKFNLILDAVGAAEISQTVEVPSYKKSFLSSPEGNLPENRRKKTMEKLKSRKLWMALLAAILPVINQEFSLGLDTNTIIAIIGGISAYIVGQAHVDATEKKNKGNEVDTKPTGDSGQAV